MKFDKRLSKLEQRRGIGADRCPQCPWLVVVRDDGPDPICPGCGRPVGIVIRHVIVTSREEIERLKSVGR
jgi:hypothetical protein